MKTKSAFAASILAVVAFFPTAALAVEGGLGRATSGMQIAPLAGVVPANRK